MSLCHSSKLSFVLFFSSENQMKIIQSYNYFIFYYSCLDLFKETYISSTFTILLLKISVKTVDTKPTNCSPNFIFNSRNVQLKVKKKCLKIVKHAKESYS
jgi:hypothetical protein